MEAGWQLYTAELQSFGFNSSEHANELVFLAKEETFPITGKSKVFFGKEETSLNPSSLYTAMLEARYNRFRYIN